MKIEKYTKKNGETAYKFRVYIGVFDGKRKYIRRSGFSSRGEARQAIFEIQQELQNQTKDKPKTFGVVYKEWLKKYETDVAESTAMKTRRNFENHILPKIGDTELSDIRPKTLESLVNEWSLKLKYSRKILGLVSNVLDYAVLHEYIDSNPANSVHAPKIKREIARKKDFYDKEELQRFMAKVSESGDIRRIALFRLLAFTGIRKGEAMAIEWSDIENQTLFINKAVTRTPAGLEIGPTKNKSSERLISLDTKTIRILDELHKARPESKLIFEDNDGHIMTPSLPRKWLLETIKGTNLPEIKIHGFRHTHASLLFESGLDLKQVQHRLGHSSLKTTMDIYTHITTAAVDDIATKFSNYIDF